jgi:hypothetical protein
MKHTVTTCAHLLAAPQWRLVYAELDVGVELKVAHGRQANGWARVRNVKRWVSTSVLSFGARYKARGCAM